MLTRIQQLRSYYTWSSTRMRMHVCACLGVLFLSVCCSSVPAWANTECKPLKTDGLRTLVFQAESSLRKSPAAALETLKQTEASLACLEDVPPAELLRNLFRFRAIAHLTLKNRTASADAFYQAAVQDSSMDCAGLVEGYGNPTLVRELNALCDKALIEAQDTEIRARLLSTKTAEAVFVDGVDKSAPGEDLISLRLIAGFHLLQVKSNGTLKSAWLQINIPEAENARFTELDLKALKLVTVVEKQVLTGTLRLDGLEPGTEVMVDGRTRRDLPVLRNVEAGERHLLIRTPDGSVMGVTVMVAANEETVYKAPASNLAPGGAGLDFKKLAGFGSLGLSGLALVGSGVTLGMSTQAFAGASTAYDSYSAATGPDADYNGLWSEVSSQLDAGRRLRSLGFVLGGVGLAAAGAGSFFILSGGGGELSFVPWIAPGMVDDTSVSHDSTEDSRAGNGVRKAQFSLGLSGRF
ncbi:MAG: hypothetical protein ACKO6N_01735 [Myxococcota bacterium]